MALQEPVPGQPLTATWGRDVVRELRSLRPLGGPGMRVTRGPNGVTIASTRKGGGDASERVGQYPFRLAFRDVLESGVTKKYAVVYVNDGAVQKDGESEVEVAECANDEATGMEQGWFDVAEYFDDESGEQVTNDLATVIASSGGVKDVYALVYYDADGVFSVAIQMTPDWSAHSSFADQIDRYYLGSIQRTDSGSGSSAITTFSITNQALRSGVVATEAAESAEELPRPWQMKFGVGASGTTGTDATPLLVYCPDAYLDGVMATVDNAEFGATGSGWYKVPYTRNASSWTNVSAFLDTEQDPPHLIVAAGNGPSGEPAAAPTGYLPATYMAVGKIATEVGPSGEELTPEVKTQYLVGDTYRAADEFRPYKPFEIRSAWDETENASIPLVYLPLVYIDGELATIDNTVYGESGSEWYEIDGAQITGETAAVTAYIKRDTDGNHVKVSTATTAPTGFTDGQIDVGDIALDNGTWKAAEQHQVGAAHKDYIKPMTLKVVGTDLLIYWPDSTLSTFKVSSTWLSLDSTQNPNAYGSWYYVARNIGSWTEGDSQTIRIDLSTRASNVVKVMATASVVGPTIGWAKRTASGYVVTQKMIGPQLVEDDGGGSGGGGVELTITEESAGATGNFVTWTSGTGPTGSIALKYHSKVNANSVQLVDGQSTADLDSYLAGSATGPGSDLGVNVNTVNFEDECLKPNDEEFVIYGTDDKAARSDHKHYASDIYASGESGELYQPFSTADYWNKFITPLQPTAMEEPDPTAQAGNVINSAMVNWDDDSRIQQDGPTGSAGGATGEEGASVALLALDNHIHPLNVVTLTTGPSAPSVDDYVMMDGPTGDLGDDPHYARVDHIHPLNVVTLASGEVAGDYVKENGPTAMLGADQHYARVDHVHPDLHPLRIALADDSAKTKIVYIPASAVQVTGSYSGGLYVTNNCERYGSEGDWYKIDLTSVPGDVYLNGYAYWSRSTTQVTDVSFTFIVTGKASKFPTRPSSYETRQFRWKIGNITDGVCENYIREAVTIPGIIAQEGPTGATGEDAGFGTPTATATTLEAGAQATASVTASGEDTAKVFSFAFGIPKGDTGDAAGFGTPTATATDLPAGSDPTATVTASGTDKSKVFSFEFGIPKGAKGDPGGMQQTLTVDEVTGDVSSNFVTYVSGGPCGDIVLHSNPNVAASAVNLNSADKSEVAVETYLLGGATGFGDNINSINYETKCLKQIVDSLIDGEESKAARSDHKHWVTDVYATGETGEPIQPFSSADSWNEHLRQIGVLTDPESTGAPEDDQTVTFGDITEGVDETMGASGIGSDTNNISPLSGEAEEEYELEASDLQTADVMQDEWVREDDTEGKGFTYTICCGIRKITDMASKADGIYAIYRTLTVDKYGMIRKISKASYGMYLQATY